MSRGAALQDKARELLQSGQVKCVIGYEVGPRKITRPAFIYQAEDVKRLVWNSRCTHNLTTYLPQKMRAMESDEDAGNVAVVVKPCDSKAIHVLMAENQIHRDRLFIIGMACDGIEEGSGYGIDGGDQLQNRCRNCSDRVPVIYDVLIGTPTAIEGNPSEGARVDANKLPAPERMEYWLQQFDRCIRCYACRQVCPMCNCPTCMYERDDSLWVGIGIGLTEKRAFHLGRAFHLAGRCIGCDECERVCPMDIPISTLNHILAREIESAYGFKPGIEPIPGPLVTVIEGKWP